MRHNSAHKIAVGGITAALAIVIMYLGGLIPFSTYVCPMLCCLLMQIVALKCGNRTGWAWFAAVSLLSILIGPDKEAAAMFLVLGYYPLIKPKLERLRFRWILKFTLFNLSSAVAYSILLAVIGADDLGLGTVGAVLIFVLIFMGNITFFLLDRLLSIITFKIKKNENSKR